MTDSDPSQSLAIRGLRFGYGGSELVRVGSLDLAAGQAALLTGPSGAGKSTLLHLIAGLLEPGSGTIEVAGQDVHALRGAKRDRFRGRHIGMVFQTFHLLPGFTAVDNVLAALMFSSQPAKGHVERASSLLSRLEIERPEASVDELSVGQQQRVAVARALACKPALVLADEPTASLDPETGAAATALLQEACSEEGAALLCVSHDPALPERFERVFDLASLATEGAPA